MPRLLPRIFFATLLLLLQLHLAGAEPSPDARKYHDMLRRRPQSGVVMQRFVDAWMKADTKESLEAFLITNATGPWTTSSDHLILALWHTSHGRDAEALTACENAIALDPENPVLHLRLAGTAARLKKWERALEALGKSGGLTGEDEAAAARLHADVLWRLERDTEAQAVFRALVQKHADDTELREEFVDLLAGHGHHQERMRILSEMGRPLDAREVAAELLRTQRDTNGNGTLDESLKCLMDYYSPAAVCQENGTVVERYVFSAFGKRRILAADYAPRSASSYAWDFAFQGQFVDLETTYAFTDQTGLLNYGYRYYAPALGRWLSRDPIREEGGMNLYSAAHNDTTNNLDLLGLDVTLVTIEAAFIQIDLNVGTAAWVLQGVLTLLGRPEPIQFDVISVAKPYGKICCLRHVKGGHTVTYHYSGKGLSIGCRISCSKAGAAAESRLGSEVFQAISQLIGVSGEDCTVKPPPPHSTSVPVAEILGLRTTVKINPKCTCDIKLGLQKFNAHVVP